MYATKTNYKIAAEILNILAKNNCTVTNASNILSYVNKMIVSEATVQKMDYLEKMSDLIAQCDD